MNRNIPFIKYLHDSDARHEVKSKNHERRFEVPMHAHTNGQLEYVHQGSMRLLSPDAVWAVPGQRVIWIPPDEQHSVHCDILSGSWKIMIPRTFRKFLPKKISVLKTTDLLVAAMRALPTPDESISNLKLNALKEIIKLELSTAEIESIQVAIPQSKHFSKLTQVILENPSDKRRIDDWAETLGMSRRTFTRHFQAEVGSSFDDWKRNLILNSALKYLSQGMSVSDIADRLGYSSPSAFIAAFKAKFGTSPLKFLKS